MRYASLNVNFVPSRALSLWMLFNLCRFIIPTYFLIYLLTHSMLQSPSWEANWFAASQEIPRISRNPKVHYRTHKRPPLVSILSQPNPVHIPTSHLLEIHPKIIHPSMPRSPQWSPSLRFPHQEPIHPPLLTHTCHMPSPSHSSRFYHPHNIGWGVRMRTTTHIKFSSNSFSKHRGIHSKMSVPLHKNPVLKCWFQNNGKQVTLTKAAHLLSHGFNDFIFFSFNQKFFGSLDQGVLGARKERR